MAAEVDLEAQQQGPVAHEVKKSSKIEWFRYGLSLNIILTLGTNTLYYFVPPAEDGRWTQMEFLLSLSPIFVVMFLAVSMYCTNKPKGDGAVTTCGGWATKCMTCALYVVAALGGGIVCFLLFHSKDSHDLVLVAISSTVPWVSVFVLSALALYSPLEESTSCFLSIFGLGCSKFGCLKKWGPFESETFWGCWESRVNFYKWMKVYVCWTVVSISFLCFLIVDYDESANDYTLWWIRLCVIGVSALCDIIMIFASFSWLKDCFFTFQSSRKYTQIKFRPLVVS